MSLDNETSSTELSENKEDFSIEDSDQKLESSCFRVWIVFLLKTQIKKL